MFCIECGSKLAENAKYCSACGVKIEFSSANDEPISDTKENEQLQESTVISNDTAETDSPESEEVYQSEQTAISNEVEGPDLFENNDIQQTEYTGAPAAMSQTNAFENNEMQQSVYPPSPASMSQTNVLGSVVNNPQAHGSNNPYVDRKKKKRKIFIVSAIILIISVAMGVFFVSFASSYFSGVPFLSNLTNLFSKSVDFERTTINLTYEVGSLAVNSDETYETYSNLGDGYSLDMGWPIGVPITFTDMLHPYMFIKDSYERDIIFSSDEDRADAIANGEPTTESYDLSSEFSESEIEDIEEIRGSVVFSNPEEITALENAAVGGIIPVGTYTISIAYDEQIIPCTIEIVDTISPIIFSSAADSIVVDENDSDYNGWSDYITAYDFSGVESLEFDDSGVNYDEHTGLSDASGEYPNSVIATATDIYGNVVTFSENVSIKEKEVVKAPSSSSSSSSSNNSVSATCPTNGGATHYSSSSAAAAAADAAAKAVWEQDGRQYEVRYEWWQCEHGMWVGMWYYPNSDVYGYV